jgi:pyridoxine 5-phosphate synthase
VPEKREERTTEGGLDVVRGHNHLTPFVRQLLDAGIRVSLFIEPDVEALHAARALHAPVVELHTGAYCEAFARDPQGRDTAAQLDRIRKAAAQAEALGLECHAGHGLGFETVKPVAAIPTLVELNIGHFLVGEAIFIGLDAAVRRMRVLMDEGRGLAIPARPKQASMP